MKFNNRSRVFRENVKTIIIIFIVVAIVAFSLIYNKFFNYSETYTVVNGTVEKVSDTYVYVLKNENVMNIDSNTAAIPIVEQDSRASKGEIIAVYKNSNYDKYQEEIAALDKEIQTLVNDLPAVYSSDVNTIDLQISKMVKVSQSETSYVTMQEYKNKVNELLSKKIRILGTLSPSGSKIRELIEKRDKLEQESKNSNNNIKAPMAGSITYKIDGIEDLVDFNNILSYDVNKLDEIISKYSSNNTSNFGIKVVDNFKCYYLTKDLESENDTYIREGRNYKIKLMNKSSDSSTYALLEKSVKSNGYVYNIFSVENNISDIIDIRQIGAEIIWTQKTGLVVPTSAITKKDDINYVTLVSRSEYVEVPVKVTITNDTIGIIENYTEEELSQLNLSTKYKIEVYDQLLIAGK